MAHITFIPVNGIFVACVDGRALVHTGENSTVLGTPKWYTNGGDAARAKVQKSLDSGRGSVLPLGDPRAACAALAADHRNPAPIVAPSAAKAAGDNFRAAVAAHRAAKKASAPPAPATPAATPGSRVAELEALLAAAREQEAAERLAAEMAAKAATPAPSGLDAALAAVAGLSAADFMAFMAKAAARRAA